MTTIRRSLLARTVRSALAVGTLALMTSLNHDSVHAAGQSGTTLGATVTVRNTCGTATHYGNILVTVNNGGSVATEGLTISAFVTQPPSTAVLSTVTVSTSAHPVLQPGESFSYPATVSLPTGTYKVTADVRITNHSGHLGTEFGPSPSADGTTTSTEGSCGGPTAARMMNFSIQQSGTALVMRWKVSHFAGISGFKLFAGTHRLNDSVIPTHTSPRYSFHTTWEGAGPYRLVILLTNGRHLELIAS